MTNRRRKPTKTVKTKTVKKMAAMAGSLVAVGAMQVDSRATIQHFTGSPVTASLSNGNGYIVGWDVDANGTVDSELTVSTTSTSFGSSGSGGIWIEGFDDGHYIASDGSDHFVRFVQSDPVGPSANFGTSSGGLIASTWSSSTSDSAIFLGAATKDHLKSGDNYIGFRLDKKDGSGDLFYGWANLNLDLTTGTASITEWAYDDTADAAILVASVPEPSSLALLAMGAGGLFAYRARQKKRSAEVTV